MIANRGAAPQQPTPQLVGAPDDDRERSDEVQHVRLEARLL
jgi:hypothetical protein